MLEINFLQQDNQSFSNSPAKFHITQLKNGNYVLSNFADHYRLMYVLKDWQKTHSLIQNPDELYKTLLETSKSIPKVDIDNSGWFKDLPSLDVSSLEISSFASEIEKDFSKMPLSDLKSDQRMTLQDKDFSKNNIMKSLKGDRVFIGCKHGYLYEYSMNEKRIVHDFGQILDDDISSMATTFDNKYLFVCDGKCDFREFDISTRTQVKNFGVTNAVSCVVTYDNQFLITAEGQTYCKLTKWSIPKRQLHTWNSSVDEHVRS